MELDCDSNGTSLSRDIFSENLHWLIKLKITNCYLENGLPSRLFENLMSLEFLRIGGGAVGLVEYDCLAGLTNLQVIEVNVKVRNGSLPPGFFDGMIHLTRIDLQAADLNFIPPNWFDGLISLETILLSDNNLQTLPAGLFDELRSLTSVAFYNNPWHCSCGLEWLLDYIVGCYLFNIFVVQRVGRKSLRN